MYADPEYRAKMAEAARRVGNTPAKMRRDRKIVEAYQEGSFTIHEIGEAFGVSWRTVLRKVAKAGIPRRFRWIKNSDCAAA